MPSYILNPDGSITKKGSDLEVDRVALTRYMKQDDTGHYEKPELKLDQNKVLKTNYENVGYKETYENANDLGVPTFTNLTNQNRAATTDALRLGISNSIGDYIIGRTGKVGDEPEMVSRRIVNNDGTDENIKGVFVKRQDKNFLLNPSFGADQHQTFYKSLNNYLFDGEIFATEIEMLAGVDLNSAGIRDLTRFWFAIDYIIESAIYIATIEAWLAFEQVTLGQIAKSEYKNVDTNVLENYTIALGNYGPVSYTKMSYFINEVLQYPKTKSSQGPLDRIGAFYTGLSLYVNSDPQILYDKLKGDTVNDFLEGGKSSPFGEIVGYLLDSLLSLTNIGEKKLIALIRRFHQKSWWHKNILYKAKDTDITKENSLESYFAELSYYYVKFAIERMHVGLKFKNYKRRNKVVGHLNRSGKYREAKFNMMPTMTSYVTGSLPKNVSSKFSTKQSMSASLLPQAFILPESLIRSYYLTKAMKPGGTLGTEDAIVEAHVLNYFEKTKKRQQRLSNQTVKGLENYYEKEMVPFYFHDMRTNEVIGFHAFIESLTDNFNVNYNSTKGFGRIDDVMHYVDTKRSISLTFMLAAMSKEDHDFIWYQINKLVSMCYPQWSDGYTKSEADDQGDSKIDSSKLSYPFSQVPTASPLIRLRVGDLIKSNYTEHAINKIHGVGNFDWDLDKHLTADRINLEVKTESALQSVTTQNGQRKPVTDTKRDAVYYLLPGTYYSQLDDKEIHVDELLNITTEKFMVEVLKSEYFNKERAKLTSKKELEDKFENSAMQAAPTLTDRTEVTFSLTDEKTSYINIDIDEKYTTIYFKYGVTEHRRQTVKNSITANIQISSRAAEGYKKITLFKVDNLSLVTYYPLFKYDAAKFTNQSKIAPGNITPSAYLTKHFTNAHSYVKAFDGPRNTNNPIKAAYETTKGKGLAGFLTMMDLNTQDQTWETEVVGSKAPKVVKISINFSPIHDIQPGLDSDGAMRAPVYNTGKIINKLYGDN